MARHMRLLWLQGRPVAAKKQVCARSVDVRVPAERAPSQVTWKTLQVVAVENPDDMIAVSGSDVEHGKRSSSGA